MCRTTQAIPQELFSSAVEPACKYHAIVSRHALEPSFAINPVVASGRSKVGSTRS